mmetsp:Transcript_52933/g.157808  ORF Transcript_52933/g.157808 Transcript_52933/m.157808 type:complete len:105 (-) Transcript_52933:574-888(-)
MEEQVEALPLHGHDRHAAAEQLTEIKQAEEELQALEGLDPNPDKQYYLRELSKAPMVCLWSRAVLPRQSDFPRNVEAAGALLLPRPEGWGPSQELAEFVARRDS